ncbi:PhzF family phenazine biosynthesis protein [Acinetobacter radioresistens]|jgi:PhzF family phenazine biosynthesis protein|uniref:PhzF family phenazine biosynthesis protein n=1 Tax=Acinetobacter radioresistens TaxID=40216 RepID=UPI000277D307|nr:PhzF family phenazine biosynthesis protein [Acinetobacter radioresistens]EJO35771.1 phenazine biosynthesis protein, PhzF family [Acinetobacter radioresistens WC-A-157]MCK4101215.1 PhzF family phenazine biosynthesis protein [Acinetobacter radioresistens]MCM1935163.1 PhzF family phenazine biosynthesis protein [Acinetobacter radioresistens]MCM1952789.1 PhzF family phenazine biosynthesis protein [Acinetobacter radioresistens]MCU4308245.1 PhzF family phenazine biosynthesis protein [Acinetobacter
MKMYQVDAFSTELFKGNPAAVLVCEEWLDDRIMQNIALENNLSETAFVKIINDENYEIRWFTPSVEVDFCGHATLASSFVLFKDFTTTKTIHFHVKDLGVFIVTQGQDGKITMNFPVRVPEPLPDYPVLLNEVVDCPFNEVYVNQQAFILVCESEQAVRDAKPDFNKIKELAAAYQRSTAITAADLDISITSKAQHYDYIARYFAPHKGIDEDPVTGSMHTGLAPLWADKLSKRQLVAYQASARGGLLYCDLKDNQRIEISGYAKLYMVAEIFLD